MFISIEGGEGVGKSTLVARMVPWFEERGQVCLRTREPGGTPVAEKIRAIFNDPKVEEPIHAVTELMLVSAARRQHVDNVIRPALKSGKTVICDRFFDSTKVYQGALGDLNESQIGIMNELACGELKPHVTVLVDCPVAIAYERTRRRLEQATRIDNKDHAFHERVRQAFLELAQREKKRFIILDGSQSSEDVFTRFKSAFKAFE